MRATPIDLDELIRQRSLSRRLLLLGAGTGAAMALAGFPEAHAQETTARVRFVNAKPRSTPVDISIDGDVVVEDLGFGEVSKIVKAPATAFTVLATPTGDDATLKKVKVGFDLTAGFAYEIVVLDDSMFKVGVLLSPIAEGAARLRMIHASPGTGSIDLATSQGEILFDGLQHSDASDYLSLPAGSIDLEILGPTNVQDLPMAPGAALTGRKAHHLYLLGSESDQSLQLVMTNWWADRGTPQELIQLSNTEFEYLRLLESVKFLLETSLQVLDRLASVETIRDSQFGALSSGLSSWIIAEEAMQWLVTPDRYIDLGDSFSTVVTPVVNAVRQIGTFEAEITVSNQGVDVAGRVDLVLAMPAMSFSSEYSFTGKDLAGALSQYAEIMRLQSEPLSFRSPEEEVTGESYLRILLQPVFEGSTALEGAAIALGLARQEAGLAPA